MLKRNFEPILIHSFAHILGIRYGGPKEEDASSSIFFFLLLNGRKLYCIFPVLSSNFLLTKQIWFIKSYI